METMKDFLYFRKQLFKPRKIKTIYPENISYTSGSKSPPEPSYISGNRSPEKLLMFQETFYISVKKPLNSFKSLITKKVLYFFLKRSKIF